MGHRAGCLVTLAARGLRPPPLAGCSLLLAGAGVLLTSCKPVVKFPEPDIVEVPADEGRQVEGDGLGTPLGDVCAHLRELGCAEGFVEPRSRRTCYQTYVHATTALHVEAPATCLLEAKDVAAVRLCGGPNTIRVRCNL